MDRRQIGEFVDYTGDCDQGAGAPSQGRRSPNVPVKYTAVPSCPAFLRSGPIRAGLEAVYSLQERELKEQAIAFQNLPDGRMQQLNVGQDATRTSVRWPSNLPVGTFAMGHTHPPLRGYAQGPSRQDSTTAAEYLRPALIIARDSIFWINPKGRSYGCAR